MTMKEEADSPESSITTSSQTSGSSSIFDDNEEVDQLLESFVEESNPPTHIEKTKTILKKRGQDYFEVLPEGWIEVTHSSGMPLYLHKQSRVCTMAKPYYLGGGSVRKHELPVSAIPCLQYRKELQKECQQTDQKVDSVGLETIQDHKRDQSLSAADVRDYCAKLFEFAEIKIRKFKTWAERRKHNSIIRERQRPSLPSDTKLITCSSSGNATSKKEFVMNPAGKSSVCILHEFVQHKEKVQPRYIYKELENSVTPYSATAEIGNIPYGVGYGKSKKDAKEDAARKTIEILIPGFKSTWKEASTNKSGEAESAQDLKFFDNIKIDDNRITELSVKAGRQSPYQILVECLKRNAGTCNTEIDHNVQLIKHHRNIYTMKVNEHEAKVECKNKREGKQLAAQVILQKMHPQVTSWGGLMRMYGRGSCKTPKEKREEEQKITELQSSATPNAPNYAILNKLKEEMLKLSY